MLRPAGLRAGVPRYVGRIGIFDQSGEYEPLLVDWRAPAARPFYLATAMAPDGVTRRRHIRSQRRTVVGLDDEVLDLSAAQGGGTELTSEAALLAALNAGRTGRMSDIVETIQSEQDQVIRAEPGGVLVVQGGPGTGKTAVALQRAAYLLYTYREQLAQRGVLIVGPNPTFLRYISQVLPSLGETSVLLRTVADLYPGISARRDEPTAVAEVKGRPVMAEVLAAAVADRQELPDDTLEIVVGQDTLKLDRRTCELARDRARGSDRPHNHARELFVREILHALAERMDDLIGLDPYADDPLGADDAPGDPHLLTAADLADLTAELAEEPNVQAALDRLWPVLTPQQLLGDLYASDARIAIAAAALPESDRQLLRRDRSPGWTVADVPLLDEAAELLGEDEGAAERRAERERLERIAYAEGVLDITAGSRSTDVEDDPEVMVATDLVGAAELAERHDAADYRPVAQRAAADRAWAFGHVIVDEAQELSAMAWRLLMRRCPSRSMTVVGDVAQTGDLAGAAGWQTVLEPYVADRWRLEELTISYRTPTEIMALAAGVLAGIDPTYQPPRSVRSAGVEPWCRPVEPSELADRLADVVRHELAALTEGRLGILVPRGRLAELSEAVRAVAPGGPEPTGPEPTGPGSTSAADPDLDRQVAVLTVRQAKGLEFDSVLVVDPAGILAESPRGHNDLYVALTRATQRLGVLHPGPLPAVLAQTPRSGDSPDKLGFS